MFLRMLAHSLVARRARLALALVAVTLGVGVATTLGTLALQVGDDFARTLRAAGPNFVIVPRGARLALDLGGAAVEPPRAGATLAPGVLPRLKDSFWRNNLLHAAPELTAAATIDGHRATLAGTWFSRTVSTGDGPWATGLAPLRPAWRIEGRWPREDADEIALGATLAERLGARVGGTVRVRASGGARAFKVSGIVRAGGLDDLGAWAPLAVVQPLAGRPGEIDRVWLSALVRPAPRTPVPDPDRDPEGYERYMCAAYPANVAAELTKLLPGAEAVPAGEAIAGEGRVVARLDLLMLLLALAALTASTLGLLGTTTATVVERSAELGLLRAIGAGPGPIAALLFGETILVGLGGGVLGWLFGSLGARAIRGAAFGAGDALEPVLLPVAIAVSLAVAVLGTLGPLRLALRIDPARVLRG